MDVPPARRRTLRSAGTDAENALWARLRAKPLLGFKFRRQHPCGPYILDFYSPSRHLAVELEAASTSNRRARTTITAECCSFFAVASWCSAFKPILSSATRSPSSTPSSSRSAAAPLPNPLPAPRAEGTRKGTLGPTPLSARPAIKPQLAPFLLRHVASNPQCPRVGGSGHGRGRLRHRARQRAVPGPPA
jgi:hypothetical protein